VKLEINTLLEKQQVEISTLVSFLRFSLGKRAPKEVKPTEFTNMVEEQMILLDTELSTRRG